MGASKKVQMRTFDSDWPDQIWTAVSAMNNGRGAAWRAAVAVLAVTGCRPAELEKGVAFSSIKVGGHLIIEAKITGVKMGENRGQPEHLLRWDTLRKH